VVYGYPMVIGWLECNVPFQHKYGYGPSPLCLSVSVIPRLHDTTGCPTGCMKSTCLIHANPSSNRLDDYANEPRWSART